MIREVVPVGEGSVPAVYLVPFHRAESSLAGGLLDLLNSTTDRLAAFAQVDWDKALAWLRGRTGQDLADEQAEAVKLALTRKVAVLTGGPGCGKSFTVRSVVELAKAKKASVVLVAPTGRAARRLAELTGHQASTVHRLLELQPGGDPKYDRGNPLDADLVVVDESSMMDVILANKLIKAVPAGAHLLLVGDVDQLPSSAPEKSSVTCSPPTRSPGSRLSKIFRQAQQSGIVVNAHRINAGNTRPSSPGSADFFLVRLRAFRRIGSAPGRGDRQAGGGHRRPPDPGQVRARPAPGRPGAGTDAPRPGRCRQPEHRAARSAHPDRSTDSPNAATAAGCSGSATR